MTAWQIAAIMLATSGSVRMQNVGQPVRTGRERSSSQELFAGFRDRDSLKKSRHGLPGHEHAGRSTGFLTLPHGQDAHATDFYWQPGLILVRQDDRYSRQVRFSGWSEEAQARLAESKVLVCGCGALGTVVADQLARAGVGELRLVDRDFVEASNLQRQVLFDERDVEQRNPKAAAAAEKLRRINSSIRIEGIVTDLDRQSIESLASGVDLIVDGTDNFETRFLVNDWALETKTPWVYAGCVGSHGQTMPIIPGRTGCLRCLIDAAPEGGAAETCETAGVLASAIQFVASLEVVTAMKLLGGLEDTVEPVLTIVDVWEPSLRRIQVGRAGCSACRDGERLWLHGKRGSRTEALCGRNAVQVAPLDRSDIDLAAMGRKWDSLGEVIANDFLACLRVPGGEHEITLFADGRAIIKGTDEPAEARALYARYVGQ